MGSQYRRQGNEFRVNSTTSGNQTDTSIAALAGGGFIITWTDLSGLDGSGAAVRAQLYDAAGLAVGSEFLVNTATANAQEKSTVTALASGGFVVSWTDSSLTGGDASGPSIKAQIYNAGGVRIGAEFLVNTLTSGSQTDATITALSTGGFVVSWADSSLTNPDRSGQAIRAQIFSPAGVKVGAEFLVNSNFAADQMTPAISSLANGGFIVTWVDNSRTLGDASGFSIKAQLYDGAGVRVGGEFLVNTSVLNNQNQVAVTSLASGKFVVTWTDNSLVGDPAGSGIKAQVFNLDGTRSGGELLVNTVTFNAQQQPTITAIPTGGFAISWSDNSIRLGDYSSYAIKTQVFDDNGVKVGTEFLVNTATTNSQEQPVITALASGALVISWTDFSLQGGDASGAGIKAQMFMPNDGPITDIALTSTVYSEASAQNTVVAALSADGPVNAVYQYELLGDSTGGAFRLEGNRLIVQDSLRLDFEAAPSADITVRVTDNFGNSFTETILIDITNALRESRFAAGGDILANTQTFGDQGSSTVTRLAAGGFVVAWIDGSLIGGDASGYGIKAQLFDTAGGKIGGELLVNTVTAGNQTQPAIGALEGGGFVVVWTDPSNRGGGAGASIIGQRYDSAGVKLGGEFIVGPAAVLAQTDAAVTGLATGGFVVSWTDTSGQFGDASAGAIVAQVYDAAGGAVGARRLVNVATTGVQSESAVTALASGGFVVTWRDASLQGGDPSGTGIKARVFDSSGNPAGSEFLVNTVTHSSQLQPAVTSLLGGGFVIAWTDNSASAGDSDYYGVQAQIFNDAGGRVGGQFLVNTNTVNAQQQAAIAPLASGGFIISWYDFSGAGGEAGGAGIRAQAFNAAGVRLGTEISVNEETLGGQADPSIAALDNGVFVTTYTDFSGNGGDTTGSGIKARVFTPLIDPNAPPALRATDDNTTGTEEQPRTLLVADLLANDINGNGGILSIGGITAVVGGSVAFDGNGDIVFTPNANFDGRAAFDYVLEDGTGATDSGRVFIQFAGVNDAPTANPDSVNASEDGTTNFGALTGNDTDPDTGDVLRVIAVPATTVGGVALTLNAGVVGFVAGSAFQSLRAGQTLTDSFSYTMADQAGLTSSATVTVTIVGANDTPFGLALSNASVDENAFNGTIVGTATASDVDSGDFLTYILTNNSGGRFAIDALTGVITVANGSLLDFEAQSAHQIGVRAIDSAGAFVDGTYAITLNNLPENRSYTGDNGANIFTASTNDFWTISGLGGNDVLTGNASSDTINGGSGNDTLDGKGGIDLLVGGIGSDTYFVDSSDDVITEAFGEGTDVIQAGATYVMPVNTENLFLLAGAGNIGATGNDFNNTMTGNEGDNTIDGGAGRDFIIGGIGNDILIGNVGSDWLQGGDGADTLIGGAGIDEFTGGTGADTFVFDSLASPAEIDLIKDFVRGDDKIAVSKAAFAAFASDPLGPLSAAAFTTGVVATTADHRLIYSPGNGALFYDPDGVGGVAGVQIASVGKSLGLTAADFIIIG